jgi:ribosome biogenesis GTPase / thiamine phosphate phosphatase
LLHYRGAVEVFLSSPQPRKDNFVNLERIGWSDFFANECPDSKVGRVALATREHFILWTQDGEIEATASGSLRHANAMWPCVGDWVVLRGESVILDVLPRRTQLSRKEPGKEVREQVLAANIDVLFIVSGLDHDYNPRRLERYVVLAHQSGARPVVLLNKADLRSDVDAVVEDTESLVPGTPVFCLSALEGWGLDAPTKLVKLGETAALIGSSGAGKSTILNRILGEHRQRTGGVREADSRGRHITTQRELILMPEGWLLMDLPGLRELQLWADPEQIDQTFADITELARQCRFRDCSHEQEPGCAVLAANIDEGRLQNYYKLKRELAYLDRRTDFQLARETKQRWKSIHKANRRRLRD